MDFVNKAGEIQESFKPYYQQTIVEEVTDPNILYDLENKLNAFGVFLKEEVEKFIQTFYKPKELKTAKDKAVLNHYVDLAVERFKKMEELVRLDFSSLAIKYVRLYSFVLQITPFEDVELHKLYLYLTFLLKKLPKGGKGSVNLADDIALEFYTNKKTFDGSVSLTKDTENVPVAPVQFAGSGVKEKEAEYLSSIIERLNHRFSTEFTKADQLSVEQIKEDFAMDNVLVQKAKTNSIDDFRFAFNKAFMDKAVDRMEQNQVFFTKILDDEQFRTALMELMLVETYEKLNNAVVG